MPKPAGNTTRPNAQYIRSELVQVLGTYRRIADTLAGSKTIKDKTTQYLPQPNPTDKSRENEARYAAYIERATFYGVTKRTVAGLVGQVFSRTPVSEIPDGLDNVEIDATGTGLSLEQTGKKMLNLNLSYSRGGIAVDYPDTGGNVTKADIDAGTARPVIQVYSPMHVINWRTMKRGAEQVLSLVVIAEAYPISDDGFEIAEGCQLKVLKLVPAAETDTVRNGAKYHYVVEIWQDPNADKWDGYSIPGKDREFQMVQEHKPTLPSGELFDEIPFMFFGSENNDVNVDYPNLADLAELNIAHYRNSADYEEACYVMGQPTYAVTGLTQQWYDDVLKKTIRLGSWGGVPLGENMDIKFVQAPPNLLPGEAMKHKEQQMIALGARLVEQRNVQRTASEATQDSMQDSSVLASCANNVSAALEWALNWCARFQNIEVPESGEGAIKYRLNTDFAMMNLSSEERKLLIAEYQGGGITWGEWRGALRQGGIASEDDKEARKAIDAERDDELNNAVKEAEAMNKVNPPKGNPNDNA